MKYCWDNTVRDTSCIDSFIIILVLSFKHCVHAFSYWTPKSEVTASSWCRTLIYYFDQPAVSFRFSLNFAAHFQQRSAFLIFLCFQQIQKEINNIETTKSNSTLVRVSLSISADLYCYSSSSKLSSKWVNKKQQHRIQFIISSWSVCLNSWLSSHWWVLFSI